MQRLAGLRRTNAPEPQSAAFAACRLGGLDLILHVAGIAFVPSEATLIVADLHLEKSARYAAGGQILPPYATIETLSRLLGLVAQFGARRVILLGDSFHSPVHAISAASAARRLIDALGAAADLIWVAGNHDPDLPIDAPGRKAEAWRIGAVVLRHQPVADGRAEIVGHFHPTARLRTRAGQQRRKCFLVSQTRLMLPAFGALTGGLDAGDPAIAGYFREPADVFLLCGEGLHAVPYSAIA